MEHDNKDIRSMIIRRNIALITIFILIFAGTITFRAIEKWDWIDSFYFVVSTSATVGFGDFTPVTHAGKLAAAIFILIMVPVLLYSFTVIAELFFERRVHRKIQKDNK